MENLEINPNMEHVLCGDISASMETRDPVCGGNTRYEYMLEKFKMFIKTAQDFDEHGAPTVMLFGENVQVFDHVTLNDIEHKLASPNFEGFTNLHLVLEEAYKLHREEKSELAQKREVHAGTCVLVFTDGEPTNRPAVERLLLRIVNEIDREDEFQIHFLIVGSPTIQIEKWLKSLHDNMENRALNPRDFDIIHVSALEDTTFLGLLTLKNHDKE
jgi:hypothetical protein